MKEIYKRVIEQIAKSAEEGIFGWFASFGNLFLDLELVTWDFP